MAFCSLPLPASELGRLERKTLWETVAWWSTTNRSDAQKICGLNGSFSPLHKNPGQPQTQKQINLHVSPMHPIQRWMQLGKCVKESHETRTYPHTDEQKITDWMLQIHKNSSCCFESTLILSSWPLTWHCRVAVHTCYMYRHPASFVWSNACMLVAPCSEACGRTAELFLVLQAVRKRLFRSCWTLKDVFEHQEPFLAA